MQLKICKQCVQSKPLDAFSLHRQTRDRKYPICRDCQKIKARAHYQKNKEKHAAQVRAWDRANPEKREAMNRSWRDRNPAYVKAMRADWQLRNPGANSSPEYLAEWRRQNRGRIAVYDRLRRSGLTKARPAWCDLLEIEAVYRQAAKLTLITEVPHQVDHIVPIKSKLVCGLHVAHNLQILTAVDNLKKGNRHWPDMP